MNLDSELYRGRFLPNTENLMCYGFECGEGWFKLIYELSMKIDEIAREYNLNEENYPMVFQVKHKAGGLRFYMDNKREMNKEAAIRIDKAIEEAEIESFKICSRTGMRKG